MSAVVVFDVPIRDPDRYRDFMSAVKPALTTAGARYLARAAVADIRDRQDWVESGHLILIEQASKAPLRDRAYLFIDL